MCPHRRPGRSNQQMSFATFVIVEHYPAGAECEPQGLGPDWKIIAGSWCVIHDRLYIAAGAGLGKVAAEAGGHVIRWRRVGWWFQAHAGKWWWIFPIPEATALSKSVSTRA